MEIGGPYDKFRFVVLINIEDVVHDVVEYVHAKNVPSLISKMEIISLERYPTLSSFALNGELLSVTMINPAAICSYIRRKELVIQELYDEMNELQSIDMFDEPQAKSLAERLISYLKTIKVGNYSGNGVMWCPENYMGDETELDQGDNENFEDYTRRLICTHIKSHRLPMINLSTIDENKGSMLMQIIDGISSVIYNDCIKEAQQTHYVSLFKGKRDLGYHGLRVLMAEEFRCVKNDEPIDRNSKFIFTEDHLKDMNLIKTPEDAKNVLRYYVGDFLDEMDLSQTYITGSAIAASIIKTTVCEKVYSKSYTKEIMIDILYPKVITEIPDVYIDILKTENVNLWNIEAISEEEGVMTKGDVVINFKIRPGADVDLAIDMNVSDDEYCAIAQRHFDVISKYYPYVKIKQYTKPKGDWNYMIYTDDPAYIPVFRTVEIYRSSFRNICSHHVGAVRGCYTSKWSESPKFYLTASAVYTSENSSSPNYHYFAGRKSRPQDIIVKYMMRGIQVADQILNNIIHAYKDDKNILLSQFPFYEGRNIPYSIFSSPIEYEFIYEKQQARIRKQQEKAERKRLREERRNNRPPSYRETINVEDYEFDRREYIRQLNNEGIFYNIDNTVTLLSSNNGIPTPSTIELPQTNVTEQLENLKWI
jgi:hypothetical protein